MYLSTSPGRSERSEESHSRRFRLPSLTLSTTRQSGCVVEHHTYTNLQCNRAPLRRRPHQRRRGRQSQPMTLLRKAR